MRRRAVALRDGRRVWLRPLTPGDADQLAAVYASLDAADQRRRFSCAGLSPADLRELAAEELLRAELGVLAVCDEGGAARPVAAGSCARDDGGYELAVTVAPGFRGASLGRVLLDALRTAARGRGVPQLRAYVRRDNGPALALLRAAGCLIVDRPGPDELALEVATDAPMPGWSASRGRRLLVEGGGWTGWPDVDRLRARGYDVRQCLGPDPRRRGCPLLAGGRCPAASDADVVLFALSPEDPTTARLRDAHAARGSARVVTTPPLG